MSSEAKSENQVKIEKGTILSAAIGMIVTGASLVQSGRIKAGGIITAIGFALLFCREHFKFNRWYEIVSKNSQWRGE